MVSALVSAQRQQNAAREKAVFLVTIVVTMPVSNEKGHWLTAWVNNPVNKETALFVGGCGIAAPVPEKRTTGRLMACKRYSDRGLTVTRR